MTLTEFGGALQVTLGWRVDATSPGNRLYKERRNPTPGPTRSISASRVSTESQSTMDTPSMSDPQPRRFPSIPATLVP